MAHKHKELMEILAHQILDGVDNPGELWEFQYEGNDNWFSSKGLPSFDESIDYRLKPKFIMINGYKVPEPERVAPPLNTAYYSPCHFLKEGCNIYYWTNIPFDTLSLENGFVHLTTEAAITHAKAIYSFTKL